MIPLRTTAVVAAVFAALSASTLAAPTTLRASHQFPGGRGDVRDEMVQIIARDAKAANVDLEVQVYPGASLFKPNEQWNALVNGQLDISSFPLDYASGKVRAFGATLMPGLVRSHRARAAAQQFALHERHQGADRQGGRRRARRRLARRRDRVEERLHPQARGHQRPEGALRGPTFASMWQSAGASIVSIRRTRSTTHCRPASPTPPTPAPAASSRSASTSR